MLKLFIGRWTIRYQKYFKIIVLFSTYFFLFWDTFLIYVFVYNVSNEFITKKISIENSKSWVKLKIFKFYNHKNTKLKQIRKRYLNDSFEKNQLVQRTRTGSNNEQGQTRRQHDHKMNTRSNKSSKWIIILNNKEQLYKLTNEKQCSSIHFVLE